MCKAQALVDVCSPLRQRQLGAQGACSSNCGVLQLLHGQPHAPKAYATVDIAQRADGTLRLSCRGQPPAQRSHAVHAPRTWAQAADDKSLNARAASDRTCLIQHPALLFRGYLYPGQAGDAFLLWFDTGAALPVPNKRGSRQIDTAGVSAGRPLPGKCGARKVPTDQLSTPACAATPLSPLAWHLFSWTLDDTQRALTGSALA
jgi:hypothetical protein